jgi:Sulfotransferase family
MTGSLQVGELVARARRLTGLDDLGPDTWQEGLTVLVASLNTEAALTRYGELKAAERLIEQLAERLKFEASYAAHPEVADQNIVSPLFGVGLGRTGSNAIGFMLSQDPARRMLRTWEANTPSPPPEPDRVARHLDPRISLAKDWVERMKRENPTYGSFVPIAAEGPAECVYLLQFDFRSQNFESWGRVPSYSEWLFGCDMEPAYRYHHRILQMLQLHYPAPQWFLRSPPHMHAMKELARVYPDARFVHTHRDVAAMIPSEAALFASLVDPLTSDPDHQYLGRHLADVRVECLRRLLAFRDDGNEDRFFDIGFLEMQTDPLDPITRLYAWLGLELTAQTRATMEHWWDENSRERHGTRRYDATEYGVTVDGLRDRFRFYADRFPQFTRPAAARS